MRFYALKLSDKNVSAYDFSGKLTRDHFVIIELNTEQKNTELIFVIFSDQCTDCGSTT